MQTVTKPFGEKELPHHQFRFGILPLNAAHVITAGLWVMHICHGIKVRVST